jgi:large subunit ribosomal protein L5
VSEQAESQKGGGRKAAPAAPVPRLKTRYREELVPRLMQERGYTNRMQVPRLEKIVVNMGVGDAVRDGRMMDAAVDDLTIVTGQKPIVTKARKSIAGFKLRQGMAIGAKVTIRGDRMWEFLDRLLSTALPRIRDFRGLSPNAFDGHGNYTIGVTEQLIFPEIDYDRVVKIRGMDITVVTTAATDEEGRALLLALGFPLQGAPAVTQVAS